MSQLRALTYAGAIEDANLLGALPRWHDLSSRERQLVLLRALEGLPLNDRQQAIFRHHTGRSVYAPPVGGYSRLVEPAARQVGKTERYGGVVTPVEAIRATRDATSHGTYCILVAQDSRAAIRTAFAYACEPFEQVPLLRSLVVQKTQDTLTLINAVRIAVYPCRPAALRGIRARLVVLDEAAHFYSSDARPVDLEVWRAAQPTLLTTGGRLVIVSSPHAQAGLVWDLFSKHYGRDDSAVLVWRGIAEEMNPRLDADCLARARAEDPEGARSELDAEFRQGVSALLDPAAIEAVVLRGVRERGPESTKRYSAFADVSGGRHDRFAVGVAHRDGDIAVLDALWTWSPPFDPGVVIRDAAARLRPYRISEVVGDRFAAEFVPSAFRAAGVTYRPSTRDRSAIYVDLAPLVNAGRVRLLDRPDLLRELRGLERIVSRGGRERVDHRRGSFDDAANACAGALTLVAARPQEAGVLDLYTGQYRTLRQEAERRRLIDAGLGDLVPLHRDA